ncbi:hypothetical protein DO97_14120 [Neosynechococcus sphagnicola sy1]|uniref:Uncharacterized protein n=1 Tax=Neosynechococcus sphagnicola sy1 TaxID=1497020 RepID=A0A098TIT7_9CYAN|nr:hypothetical protein [Neosynechococcus sphagnicola]KGF71951.1 hypothetical protein DO97_14120 [Neosynechococcus sphagnicola sy1]
MSRHNPYTLQMQITQLFEQGQSFFATIRVQDWLRDRNEDPSLYEILFHEKSVPSGVKATKLIEIELRRRDGQAIDPWLQQEINRQV